MDDPELRSAVADAVAYLESAGARTSLARVLGRALAVARAGLDRLDADGLVS